MEILKINGMTLDDGSRVVIEYNEGGKMSGPGKWKALDILLIYPDGKESEIAAIDYSDGKLVVKAFDSVNIEADSSLTVYETKET